MISMLRQAFAKLRVWLGMNDPSENHPHQAHGWLLPPVGALRGRAGQAFAVARAVVRPHRRED